MPQRFLRPGITNSERWNSVPWPAQSFFIRILTLVDDFGQYDARPAVLWGQCFQIWNTTNQNQPIELQQVAQMLQQLAASQLIEIYISDCGKQFLQVSQWQERIRDGCKRKYPINAKLQQVAASCSVLLPPSSPSPSPPSPTPVPTPTPVSPPKPIVPRQTSTDSLSHLRTRLNQEYRRPETARWSCLEEGLLAEVARRDHVKGEILEIVNYRLKLPESDLKFFPQSVAKLLEKWDQILDQSRNHVAEPKKKTMFSDDIARLKREVDSI